MLRKVEDLQNRVVFRTFKEGTRLYIVMIWWIDYDYLSTSLGVKNKVTREASVWELVLNYIISGAEAI